MQRQVLLRGVGVSRRLLSTTATSATSTTVSSGKATVTSADKPTGPAAGKKMRLVVAVGGNALQRRGERLTIENMLKAAADMAPVMAELTKKHELGKNSIPKFVFWTKKTTKKQHEY